MGPGLLQVRTVASWYRTGHFENDDEARGAFRLAYQQGLDGMGPSVEEWMGLTPEEFDAWMRDEALPAITEGPHVEDGALTGPWCSDEIDTALVPEATVIEYGDPAGVFAAATEKELGFAGRPPEPLPLVALRARTPNAKRETRGRHAAASTACARARPRANQH